MAHPHHDVSDLRLLGGRLCIDFVNTIENRAGETSEDFLTAYSDLVRWAGHAGLLTDADVAQLMEAAASDEPGARRVLAEALDLRETLHRLFLAIATSQGLDDDDLEQIRRAYGHAIAGARLTPDGDHFGWDWRPNAPRLEQVLWPVALSVIELLTEGDLRRVKVCANPHGCGWLFYDGSKNLSRRWCSMEGCGSQLKMRRQYAKRRAGTSESAAKV
jgi:predicted RNA-binding Zn ribbon-like protein